MITGEAGPVLLLIAMLWAWTWMLITTIKFVVREKKDNEEMEKWDKKKAE